MVVEGQTEESFVKNLLTETLWPKNVHPTPILLGSPSHKGGRTSYVRVKKDILRQLKQDTAAFCSTMIDYYGLGAGFPGYPPSGNLSALAKVQYIEHAMEHDIGAEIPEFRPDLRFIPYLQLHEFEALLFSDPTKLADGIYQPKLARQFQNIRDQFDSPEDIDNSPDSAPSKRILALHRSYQKVSEGTLAAFAVGIPAMRAQCPHFNEWVQMLETLSTPSLTK